MGFQKSAQGAHSPKAPHLAVVKVLNKPVDKISTPVAIGQPPPSDHSECSMGS